MSDSNTLNKRLLSGTFLVVCVSLASGCGMVADTGHMWGDIFGETRTVPDDDTVNFGNRHSPVLNPSSHPMPGQPSAADSSSHSDMSATQPSVSASAPAPMVSSVTTAPTNRQVPVENQSILAGTPPAMVEGTASTAMPVNTSSTLAAPAPVVTGDIPPAGAAPSLANIPPAPSAPPADQTKSQFKSLAADQTQSEASRQHLLNDPSATVMTSPKTGQLVDNAANASAVASPPSSLNAEAPVSADTPHVAIAEGTALPSPVSMDPAPQPPAQPAGVEVAHNVILGAAPPFPPVPNTAAQPMPNINAQAVATPVAPAVVTPAPVNTATPSNKTWAQTFAEPVPPAAQTMQPPAAAPTPAAPIPVASAPDTSAMAAPTLTPPAPDASATTAVLAAPGGTVADAPVLSTPPALPAAPMPAPVAPAMTAETPPAPVTPPPAPQPLPQSLNTPMPTPTLAPPSPVSSLPDVSQVSTSSDPINLVPPSQSSASAHYLPDSRYDSRRSQGSTE